MTCWRLSLPLIILCLFSPSDNIAVHVALSKQKPPLNASHKYADRAVLAAPPLTPQVKKSEKVDITPTGGLRLTTEVKTEEAGEGGDKSPNGGSRRNSKKRDASSSASKVEKPAEKSGCCVM